MSPPTTTTTIHKLPSIPLQIFYAPNQDRERSVAAEEYMKDVFAVNTESDLNSFLSRYGDPGIAEIFVLHLERVFYSDQKSPRPAFWVTPKDGQKIVLEGKGHFVGGGTEIRLVTSMPAQMEKRSAERSLGVALRTDCACNLKEFRAFQKAIKALRLTPYADWPSLRGLFARVLWSHAVPEIEIEIEDGAVVGNGFAIFGLLACAWLLFLEKAVEGAEYRICAKPDCAQWFKLDTLHDRKYHSSHCAHAMAVRQYRARRANDR